MENPAGDVPVISDAHHSQYTGQYCKLEWEHKQPLTTCQPHVGFSSHTVCGLPERQNLSNQHWGCGEGERWEQGGVMALLFGYEQRSE